MYIAIAQCLMQVVIHISLAMKYSHACIPVQVAGELSEDYLLCECK